MSRIVSDCRRFPSDSNCSLTISGEEEEVMDEVREHAIRVHGHERGPELDSQLQQGIESEPDFYRRISGAEVREPMGSEDATAF